MDGITSFALVGRNARCEGLDVLPELTAQITALGLQRDQPALIAALIRACQRLARAFLLFSKKAIRLFSVAAMQNAATVIYTSFCLVVSWNNLCLIDIMVSVVFESC